MGVLWPGRMSVNTGADGRVADAQAILDRIELVTGEAPPEFGRVDQLVDVDYGDISVEHGSEG